MPSLHVLSWFCASLSLPVPPWFSTSLALWAGAFFSYPCLLVTPFLWPTLYVCPVLFVAFASVPVRFLHILWPVGLTLPLPVLSCLLRLLLALWAGSQSSGSFLFVAPVLRAVLVSYFFCSSSSALSVLDSGQTGLRCLSGEGMCLGRRGMGGFPNHRFVLGGCRA